MIENNTVQVAELVQELESFEPVKQSFDKRLFAAVDKDAPD